MLATTAEEKALLNLTDAAAIDAALASCDAERSEAAAVLSSWMSTSAPQWTDSGASTQQLDSFYSSSTTPALGALRKELVAASTAAACHKAAAERVVDSVGCVTKIAKRAAAASRRAAEQADLAQCLGAVSQARTSGDPAAAVRGLARYLRLDAAALDAPARAALTAAVADLKQAVDLQAAEAVAEQNDARVRELCSLYGLLGFSEEGMGVFRRYIRNRLTGVAENRVFSIISNLRASDITKKRDREGQDEGQAVQTFATGMARLCENIAANVQTMLPSAERPDMPLWPGSIFPILQQVQEVGDELGVRVIETFMQCVNLQQLLADVKGKKRSDTQFDAGSVGPILDEMVSMCQTASVFDSFLRSRDESARKLYDEWFQNSTDKDINLPIPVPLDQIPSLPVPF